VIFLFKGLTIASIIIILIVGFTQLFLPAFAQKQASAILRSEAQAENAQVAIEAMPAAKLLFGKMDTLSINAQNALVGQIRVDNLDLQGKNVQVNMNDLLFSKKLRFDAAQSLVLKGTIKEDALVAALQKKVEKLKDVEVEITPDAVQIQGNVPLAGRKIEVSIEGTIRAQDGGIYFHMRKTSIHNAILGKAVLGSLFEDIMLADLRTSPFQLEATDVVQKNGEIDITLSR
jgi:hypothetical protein